MGARTPPSNPSCLGLGLQRYLSGSTPAPVKFRLAGFQCQYLLTIFSSVVTEVKSSLGLRLTLTFLFHYSIGVLLLGFDEDSGVGVGFWIWSGFQQPSRGYLHCRKIMVAVILCGALIGSNLFLLLVTWSCGGVDLKTFNMSRVALAIRLSNSLGNNVAWVRDLGLLGHYSSRITIWDPGGI